MNLLFALSIGILFTIAAFIALLVFFAIIAVILVICAVFIAIGVVLTKFLCDMITHKEQT